MRTFLLISLLTSLLPHVSLAADIDVYTGEAVVASQDAGERRRALPLALENVLQKFSGLRAFDDWPGIGPMLETAPSILVSFHYRNAGTTLADGSAGEEMRLVASFSSERVDEIARQLQLPLWQTERAPTEIWVVIEDHMGRRILPVEYNYAWKAMADTAEWRGLPVNWPFPEEEGRYAVDEQLLWGGYTEDLQRSRAGGVMVTAARREGVEWQLRGNLTYGDQTWTWRLQDIDLEAALTESMEQAADLIASANAISAGDLGTWTRELTVQGFGNSGDYRRCLAYLQELNVVDHVFLVSAQPGVVTFRLELNALPRYLEENLRGSPVLGFDEDAGDYYLLPPDGMR